MIREATKQTDQWDGGNDLPVPTHYVSGVRGRNVSDGSCAVSRFSRRKVIAEMQRCSDAATQRKAQPMPLRPCLESPVIAPKRQFVRRNLSRQGSSPFAPSDAAEPDATIGGAIGDDGRKLGATIGE